MDASQAPRRIPTLTDATASRIDTRERIERALLSDADGHRAVVELDIFVRAMGLDAAAVEHLRDLGLLPFVR